MRKGHPVSEKDHETVGAAEAAQDAPLQGVLGRPGGVVGGVMDEKDERDPIHCDCGRPKSPSEPLCRPCAGKSELEAE